MRYQKILGRDISKKRPLKLSEYSIISSILSFFRNFQNTTRMASVAQIGLLSPIESSLPLQIFLSLRLKQTFFMSYTICANIMTDFQ